jgi:hypothetical protein
LSRSSQPDFLEAPETASSLVWGNVSVGDPGGITIARFMPVLSRSDGLFSLGAVLARYWHPAYPLLPWAFTSAMLTVAGMWDRWFRGGQVDYVVLGLAAYELMIGLLLEGESCPVQPAVEERQGGR